MPYVVYIEAKTNLIGKPRWYGIERLPTAGSYITKTEAEAQAKHNLNYWKRHKRGGKLKGKYDAFRSRIVRVK